MNPSTLAASILRAFHQVFIEMPLSLWAILATVGTAVTDFSDVLVANIDCAFIELAATIACSTQSAMAAVFATASTYFSPGDIASLTSLVSLA